jgi:O-antigen ligase
MQMIPATVELSASKAGPRYGVIYLLPYLILMICRVSNFGAQTVEASDDDGMQKMLLEAISYLIAVVLVGMHFISVRQLLGRMLPFYLYVAYAALTWFWSAHPDAVQYRVGHMLGLLAVAVCVAMWAQDRREKLFFVSSGFVLTVLILSVAAVFLFPGRGLAHPEWGSVGGSRWVGITGHPNLLGTAAMVGVWTAVAVLATTKSTLWRLLAWVLILLAMVALRGSDSRSSEIAAAFAVVTYLLLRGANPSNLVRVFFRRVLVLAVVAGIVVAVAFLIDPEFTIRHLTPTTRAGAGDVLSDRPLIWAMGFEAIRDNPFGWTYDLLQSYWDVHGREVLFPHFHNGFLDVAVKGGFVGEILLLGILGRMAWSLKRLMTVDYQLFALYASFFASNLLYNIIDTGFDREAILWPMMVVAWAVVEATVIAHEQRNTAVSRIGRPYIVRARPAAARMMDHDTNSGVQT